MIEAEDFLGPAVERGYTFWSGVPCSFLTPFINYVISSPNVDYVAATSEGEAVAVAFGAHLTGRRTGVMCQNSGLGNAVNPLTSLNWPFRVPTILLTTHRGAPGLTDEPQHELMGEITPELFEVLRLPWTWFPDEPDLVGKALDEVEASCRETGRPYAFLLRKGTVAPYPLRALGNAERPAPGVAHGEFEHRLDQRMTRFEAIATAREALGPDYAVLGTTGKIGRELFTLGHRPNQFYVVGGMGCAAAIGLGVHDGASGARPVAVLDGDGSVLMKLGTLATVGHYAPARYTHLVLDNEAHESTGGQATVSSTVDLAAVAVACGYRRAFRVDTPEALLAALNAAVTLDGAGPCLIHAKVAVGSAPDLARPTVTPEQVKQQFMEWFAS